MVLINEQIESALDGYMDDVKRRIRAHLEFAVEADNFRQQVIRDLEKVTKETSNKVAWLVHMVDEMARGVLDRFSSITTKAMANAEELTDVCQSSILNQRALITSFRPYVQGTLKSKP